MASTTSRWKTAIARVLDDDVAVRGYRLSDLVAKVSYIDMVFLEFVGEQSKYRRTHITKFAFAHYIQRR